MWGKMKRKILQCLICVIIIVGIVSTTQWRPVHDIEAAYEKVLSGCVRIQTDGYYGSGNVFDVTEEEIIVITNKHVLQNFDENSCVLFRDRMSVQAEVLGVSDYYDVGFLRIQRVDFKDTGATYQCVCTDLSRYEKLERNDAFFMVDVATDMDNPQMYMGEIIEKEKYLPDYHTEMLYGDAYARPGMSGAGLFDGYGNYIGILSGGTDYVEIAAVGIDKILEEYEKIKTRFT